MPVSMQQRRLYIAGSSCIMHCKHATGEIRGVALHSKVCAITMHVITCQKLLFYFIFFTFPHFQVCFWSNPDLICKPGTVKWYWWSHDLYCRLLVFSSQVCCVPSGSAGECAGLHATSLPRGQAFYQQLLCSYSQHFESSNQTQHHRQLWVSGAKHWLRGTFIRQTLSHTHPGVYGKAG